MGGWLTSMLANSPFLQISIVCRLSNSGGCRRGNLVCSLIRAQAKPRITQKTLALKPCPHQRRMNRGPALVLVQVFLQGYRRCRYFESGIPFIVAKSTGIDACSCAITHWPLTFLYPSVTRTVRLTFLP